MLRECAEDMPIRAGSPVLASSGVTRDLTLMRFTEKRGGALSCAPSYCVMSCRGSSRKPSIAAPIRAR
jgi:hypothetical protein